MVIDEISKMECHLSMFVEVVRELLDAPTPLLATLAQRGAGIIREVKDRKDINILPVTTVNRDLLPGQIVDRIKN